VKTFTIFFFPFRWLALSSKTAEQRLQFPFISYGLSPLSQIRNLFPSSREIHHHASFLRGVKEYLEPLLSEGWYICSEDSFSQFAADAVFFLPPPLAPALNFPFFSPRSHSLADFSAEYNSPASLILQVHGRTSSGKAEKIFPFLPLTGVHNFSPGAGPKWREPVLPHRFSFSLPHLRGRGSPPTRSNKPTFLCPPPPALNLFSSRWSLIYLFPFLYDVTAQLHRGLISPPSTLRWVSLSFFS